MEPIPLVRGAERLHQGRWRTAGARAGAVRHDPSGVAAYQAYFARRGDGATTLAWVSVATDARMGAGRNFDQAWSNLLGSYGPDRGRGGSGRAGWRRPAS